VNSHLAIVERFRERSIASLESGEQEDLRILFARFENALGAVGAAKCLHLLAPSFFPLWDRAIAKAYKVKCNDAGQIHFMRRAKEQCRGLAEQGAPWPDLLKAVDEYNCCNYQDPECPRMVIMQSLELGLQFTQCLFQRQSPRIVPALSVGLQKLQRRANANLRVAAAYSFLQTSGIIESCCLRPGRQTTSNPSDSSLQTKSVCQRKISAHSSASQYESTGRGSHWHNELHNGH